MHHIFISLALIRIFFQDHQGEKLLVDAKGEETQNEEVEEKLVDDTVRLTSYIGL
jgi:hypothetical protein